MNETPAPDPTPASTDDVVDYIIQTVKQKNHKVLTRDTARTIYEGILKMAIEQSRQHGYFKLPYGYGQFYVRVVGLNAKPRRLPGGELVNRTPKPVMRYKMGSTSQALLEGKVPKTAKEVRTSRKAGVR